MDRPGGGRDEAEGSEARARVGAAGRIASYDSQLAPALGSFETAPGWPRIASPSRCHA